MTELHINGAKADIKNIYNFTLLHQINDTKTLEHLINLGLDVNAQNNEGNTPLHLASNVENAKLLLKNGAKIDVRNNWGETPIFYKDAKTTEFLISKGANVNDRDNFGRTPLHAVAGYKCEEIIEVLITHGAVVNATDKYGQTPLRIMSDQCEICCAKSYKAFFSHKADISFSDVIGLLAKGRIYTITYPVKKDQKCRCMSPPFLRSP